MSDDIVERLDKLADGLRRAGRPGRTGVKTVEDAADEIERLSAVQGLLIDACGLALNYRQEVHVDKALRAAIDRALGET